MLYYVTRVLSLWQLLFQFVPRRALVRYIATTLVALLTTATYYVISIYRIGPSKPPKTRTTRAGESHSTISNRIHVTRSPWIAIRKFLVRGMDTGVEEATLSWLKPERAVCPNSLFIYPFIE